MRKINEAGFKLLTTFEGCRLKPYQDQGGLWTVGYGHVIDPADFDKTITQQQAEDYLREDLEQTYRIERFFRRVLTDNEYSACCVLAYNIGVAAFRNSTILLNINDGKDPGGIWLQYCHVHGTISPGLLRRRQAEYDLFNAK